MVNRYAANYVRLEVRGVDSAKVFATMTDLTTGRERGVDYARGGAASVVERRRCPARHSVTLWWTV
jgi:hypothetical protein